MRLWIRVTAIVAGMVFFAASAGAGEARRRGPEAGRTRGGRPVEPRKYGVVAGVNRYSDAGINSLTCCVADATAVHKALTSAPGGFGKEHLALLTDDMPENLQPTRNNILKCLSNYVGLAGPEDTVLIYFSGHGATLDDKLYLIPADASTSMLRETTVAFEDIKKMLSQSAAARKVVLLDACHSGAGKSLDQWSPGVASQLEFESKGTVVLASCGPEEFSYEMSNSGHSSFTCFMLEGLSGPADANEDGLIGAKELSTYTWDKTRVWAVNEGLRQNPWELSRVSGDIILSKVFPDAKSFLGSGATIVASASAEAPQPKAGAVRKVLVKDGAALEMVWVPAGTFMMGSPEGEAGREGDEGPQHEVRISDGFWMSTCEITNGLYQLFKPDHASGSYNGKMLNREEQPVVNVSWDDANAFCAWLSERTGERFRLPTEAEWEYACRAGAATPTPWGELDGNTGDYANVPDLTAKEVWPRWDVLDTTDGHAASAPVGSFGPNAWGLQDMIGNVLEWCADAYGDIYYTSSPSADPKGPDTGRTRVVRGGSWDSDAKHCRSASRSGCAPDHKGPNLGFRVVCEARP